MIYSDPPYWILLHFADGDLRPVGKAADLSLREAEDLKAAWDQKCDQSRIISITLEKTDGTIIERYVF